MTEYLNETDRRGLLRQALCEAMGGFAAHSFPEPQSVIARGLLEAMDAGAQLRETDIDILAHALRFSLEQLGPEEFDTITGYDFEFGTETLLIITKLEKQMKD